MVKITGEDNWCLPALFENGNLIMDMLQPAMFGQLVVAACVAYSMHITFFRPKAVDPRLAKQRAAMKDIVKQRSERWAI
jgi:hypothetical protein